MKTGGGISPVDCFAITLTNRPGGTLLTSDHHELDAIAGGGHLFDYFYQVGDREMSEGKSSKELLEELKRYAEQMKRDAATRTTRVRVNKRTHRIRFENETEEQVEVVVEPLEAASEE